jgi:hypothetical protein
MSVPAEILKREGALTARHHVISEVLSILKNGREMKLEAKTIAGNLEKKIRQGIPSSPASRKTEVIGSGDKHEE